MGLDHHVACRRLALVCRLALVYDGLRQSLGTFFDHLTRAVMKAETEGLDEVRLEEMTMAAEAVEAVEGGKACFRLGYVRLKRPAAAGSGSVLEGREVAVAYWVAGLKVQCLVESSSGTDPVGSRESRKDCTPCWLR